MMKHLLLTLSMLFSALIFAQTPQGFSYQAVVRNNSGSPITNQYVGVKIILQSASGTEYYSETQRPQTNNQGVFTLVIGNGTQFGPNTFSSIPWSTGDVEIKLEVDATGGTSYVPLGNATKLQSVPYALYTTGSAQGPAGKDGISINWRGTFTADPSNPSLNDAYYNSIYKKSYIYDASNTWQILAQDGMPINGTANQTLYYNSTTGWTPTSNIINDNTNVGIGIAPTTKFDVNGGIRLRGALYDGTLASLTPGSSNQILTSTGSGVLWKSASSLSLASGTGAVGQLALWTGTNSGLKGVSNLTWGTSLQVASLPSAGVDDPIFEVKNKDGKVVFGVYQGGVRVNFDDSGTKGARGGFAVGGLSQTKAGTNPEYFRITMDSARIYLKNVAKGARGGFAVGGLSQTKGINNYMQLTSDNYFIGQDAGKSIDKGQYNIFIGYQAGMNTTGNHGDMDPTDGDNNIFLGYRAGTTNTTGQQNIYIGAFSGENNTTGDSNTFLGSETGKNNNGYGNTFIGALSGATSVSNTGAKNTFVGSYCGTQNSSGEGNVFIGRECGSNNTSGSNNVYIGHLAGNNNSTGSGNVFIGSMAGWTYSGNNTLIVNNSDPGLGSQIPSSALIFGDFSTKSLRFNANIGIGNLSSSAYGLVVNGGSSTTYSAYFYKGAYATGNFTSGSDRRWKKNVNSIENALEKVMKLRGVTFFWDTNNYPEKQFDTKKQIGVIAQEVEEVFPELVITDVDGYKGVNYPQISAVLIEAIKEQQKKIELLEEKLKELDSLKAELEAIKALLKK